MNENMNSYMPVRLFTGEGCIQKNKKEFARLGKKGLIVTGRSSARKCGALKDVTEALEDQGIGFVLFEEIGQNPLLTDCVRAARKAVEEGCDFIIGIGGGSPMDAAKCISVLAANPGMTEEELYLLNWPEKPLPVAVVGTTAGTGSEVTKVAVITVPGGRKKSFHHDLIFPAAAFGDPSYTMSLPEDFTLSTAIDTVAHATESFFSRKANDISKCYAVQSLKSVLPVLERVTDPENRSDISPEERTKLYHGSIYGGLAINITGTCLPHTMGYLLTEKHGIPHGNACAIFLPEWLRILEEQMPGRLSYPDYFYYSIQCERERFFGIIGRALKDVHVTISEQEIAREHSRWIGNRSIANSLAEITPEMCDEILRKI